MLRKTIVSFLFLIAIHSLQQANPVVAGYFENWSQYRPPSGGRSTFMPNMIDPTLLTDLYYAFAIFGYISKSIDPSNPHLTGNYTIQPIEWNDTSILYPQIQALKKINPNLKNILSIGGWSFNDPQDPNGMGPYTYKLYSQMVASPSAREEFIQSAIDYAHKYAFDGIDIDWEYPGDLTRGGSIEDFDNFLLFLQECKMAFSSANPPLILSYAAPAIVPSGVPSIYKDNPTLYFQWLSKCSTYVDRIGIMAYDYHGPFDSPKLTGVNAPLKSDTDPLSILYITKTLDNYIQNGVAENKIILGLPTYGHSYGGVSDMTLANTGPGNPFISAGAAGPSTNSPGLLAYFEIGDMITLKQLTFGADSLTSTAYGYNLSSCEWVSFDTPETIALKTNLAKNKNLQGVMVWAVDMDEYAWTPRYPNIRSAYTTFYPQK